ncbi:MAG: AEC family transporter [Rhodoferax sp.]|nr:AEC family transporter [Rhodoferax sp.]
MSLVVLSALLPVVALILLGLLVGRTGWVSPAWVGRLSTLSFMVLTPVVLFRTMGRVHVEQLDLRPAAVYIAALGLVFAGMVWWRGMNRTAVVLALGVTYSNAVMIGIPLVQLAWGDAGLVTLLTLIPVHSLVLLTAATVALEFALAREQAARAPVRTGHLLRVSGLALRKALLHPVPLPIIAGLLFAQTGWVMPPLAEQLMRWVGMAFGPLALMLVGIALAGSTIGAQMRPALQLAAIKNLAVPVLAAGLGWALGMRGVPLTVLVATAALPMGANVFIFSQRYGVAQPLITASVAVSTLLALASVSLVMVLAGMGQD